MPGESGEGILPCGQQHKRHGWGRLVQEQKGDNASLHWCKILMHGQSMFCSLKDIRKKLGGDFDSLSWWRIPFNFRGNEITSNIAVYVLLDCRLTGCKWGICCHLWCDSAPSKMQEWLGKRVIEFLVWGDCSSCRPEWSHYIQLCLGGLIRRDSCGLRWCQCGGSTHEVHQSWQRVQVWPCMHHA